MELYPLLFEPILKDKIWGGNKLVDLLHRSMSGTKVGESWELSAINGSVSVVRDGAYAGATLTALLEQYPRELLGDDVSRRFGATFPLLFKFIDASDDLSIQVHPDDALARVRHSSFGKTEMWYVLQADPGARLIVGFDHPSSSNEYQQHLNDGNLMTLLRQVEVQAGDAFFLAPGTIHAIGAGIMLAEIQQASDITYRVYDWDRTDADGNTRELHIEQAMEAMNYNVAEAQCRYETKDNSGNTVAVCSYFTTNFIPLNGRCPIVHDGDSFRVYMCTEGRCRILTMVDEYEFGVGDTVLVPAALNSYELLGRASLLEVYVTSS